MILITGAFGQLGKLLQKELPQSSEVILVDRNIKNKNTSLHLSSKAIDGDLSDINFCQELFSYYQFKTIFNFATNSFVERNARVSTLVRCNIFDNIIQSIEKNGKSDSTWLLHPLSSEIFGIPNEIPQTEKTIRSPINEYGLQKSLEESKCIYLRNSGYQIYNPILNNAESLYRSERFFTKKIISHLKKIKSGLKVECLDFYNATSSRDFGYARDYVKNFIDASRNRKNKIELLGSGINFRIIDFIQEALHYLELKTEIVVNEKGFYEIYFKNIKILQEKQRCSIDEKRVFVSSSLCRNDQPTKIRGGKELIKILNSEYN